MFVMGIVLVQRDILCFVRAATRNSTLKRARRRGRLKSPTSVAPESSCKCATLVSVNPRSAADVYSLTCMCSAWARTSLPEDYTLPAGCPQPPLLLADLRHADNFVDVVTRILHVNTAMETVRLVVWDGSGNAADSDPELVQLLTNGQVSVPDHGVIIEIAMNSCWMIVQQMGYVDHFDDNWCRFRNLAITTPEPTEASSSSSPDFHVLRFREVSSLLLVPKDIPEVKTRLDLVNGVVSPSPSQPTDELAPDTNQSVSLGSSTEVRTVVPVRILKSIPVTPLASVVSTRQAPRKYHCHVRFVKMWPTEIIKIAKSKPGSSGEFVFSFVLSVEDDSGTLDAIVHGQDAVRRAYACIDAVVCFSGRNVDGFVQL